MEEFINLLKEYGPYISLPVLVAGLTQVIKNSFSSIKTKAWGVRVLPLVPIVLGIMGGFLLPLASVSDKVLVGGALGQLSTLIYEAVTKTFAIKVRTKE